MTTQQLLGFKTTFTGIAKGVLSKPRHNADRSREWIQREFVVEGREFTTVNFRLSKEAQDAGLHEKLEKLAGQLVHFECFSNERVYKDRIYKDFYLAGTELPRVINGAGGTSGK